MRFSCAFKRCVSLLLILVLFVDIAVGEGFSMDHFSFYQSNKSFAIDEGTNVREVNGKGVSLGQLVVNASFLDDSGVTDDQSFFVEYDTAASFSYLDISLSTDKSQHPESWYITDDNASEAMIIGNTVEKIAFGGKMKNGVIVVQKSYDQSEWTTVFQDTNIFENHKTAWHNFYTASRSDVNAGCYYRIIFAYKIERRAKQQNFWFIDTSSYERKWCVETYQIFLLGDDNTVFETADISMDGSGDTDVDAGMTTFGNQSAINNTAAVDTFNMGDGSAGMAGEAGNVQAHAEQGLVDGSTVVHTGADNAKNGADYVITSSDGIVTQVQSKYYSTPNATISACFENDLFRYYSDVGVPMTIEVPKDQYDSCVTIMRRRIANGQVPGVTNPDQASEIVRPGSVTYRQAVNVAKAGTIESLVYDAKTGCVSSLISLGISAVVQFAVDMWNQQPVETALKNSLYTGLRVGGNAFVTSVLSSQLTRTGLNSLLVPASEVVIKAIGSKAAAVIVNAGRVGMTPIYGAAAMKSAARMLRGGVIVNTVSFLVFTIPDAVSLFRGRISGKQMVKNMAVTGGGIGGAALGAQGGALLGTAIAPGIGTTIGGIVGGLLGGIGVSIGVDKVADLIAEDDADEMLDIITVEYQNLINEYLLNENEATAVSEYLSEELNANSGKLKDMFASEDRHTFAREMIEPAVREEISKRENIVLPDEEVIQEVLIDTLEEIYDMELATEE